MNLNPRHCARRRTVKPVAQNNTRRINAKQPRPFIRVIGTRSVSSRTWERIHHQQHRHQARLLSNSLGIGSYIIFYLILFVLLSWWDTRVRPMVFVGLLEWGTDVDEEYGRDMWKDIIKFDNWYIWFQICTHGSYAGNIILSQQLQLQSGGQHLSKNDNNQTLPLGPHARPATTAKAKCSRSGWASRITRVRWFFMCV